MSNFSIRPLSLIFTCLIEMYFFVFPELWLVVYFVSAYKFVPTDAFGVLGSEELSCIAVFSIADNAEGLRLLAREYNSIP
jgi:hypothetical protein